MVGSKIYVISGEDDDCTEAPPFGTVTTAVDIYDTVTNTFAPGPSVNIGRTEAPLAATVGNSVYLIGGDSKCLGPAVVQVEKLDLNTNTWSVLGSRQQPARPAGRLPTLWSCPRQQDLLLRTAGHWSV